jgi:ketosteroid isomerase-like protein
MTRQSDAWKGSVCGSIYIVLFGYGVFAFSSFGNASSNSDAREAVRCSEIAFSRSVEAKDEGYFASFIDDDARFISDTVLRGPMAIVEAWAPFFDESGPKILWRPYYIEVAETGDLAFSRGPYRISGRQESGDTYESWGIYNSVWRKAGDTAWNIIFDAGNPGEDQLNEAMQSLLDEPIRDCDVQLDRKNRLG